MQHAPHVVRSNIVIDFRRLALAVGLDPAALTGRVGLDTRSLEQPGLPLPAQRVVDLLEVAALSSRIDDFGFRLGVERGLPDLGPAILMLRAEETVRDALRTLMAMLHLHTGVTLLRLEEEGDPILAVDLLVGDPRHCKQTIDLNVAGITHIMRWLLGGDWVPALACFTRSRPASAAHFARFFRAPVDFMQEFNGVVLHPGDLDRRLPSSSPALRRQVRDYLRSIDAAPSDTYLHQVRQVVAMALPRGDANADFVAGCLGTYRQALNRRLGRSGLNYSAVVENVRRNLTVQYLESDGRSLTEIAGLVGFASLSAFTRWFARSFHCPPSRWRRMPGAVRAVGPAHGRG